MLGLSEILSKKLTGVNSIDVKEVCKKLNIQYMDKAELYSIELQNTLNMRNKCTFCKKQGKETVDCYYPTAYVDDWNGYRIGYSLCPKAQKYLCQQKINKLMEASGISSRFREKTFGNFKTTPQTLEAFNICRNFVIGYKPNVKGLRLWGNYGTGKTHLITAIVNNLLTKNVPCMFVVVPELLEYLRQGIKNEDTAQTATELINMAKKADVLVLDDLGAEKPSNWVKEQLFILINSRYENQLTTLITTNLSTAELVEQIGQRIMSRIIEMTESIEIKADNHRLRKAI